MPEQILNVELAGVLLDGPSGEGVTEAVSMHFGDPGLACKATEHLLEAVGLEGDA